MATDDDSTKVIGWHRSLSSDLCGICFGDNALDICSSDATADETKWAVYEPWLVVTGGTMSFKASKPKQKAGDFYDSTIEEIKQGRVVRSFTGRVSGSQVATAKGFGVQNGKPEPLA